MIRSMTGFGEAERDTPAGRVRCEIKTVNHRYFSVNLRMSAQLERFEPQVREWLRGLLPRGHVNASLRLQNGAEPGEKPPLILDEARAQQYLDILRGLKDRFGLPGDVDIATLARFNDLIRTADPENVDAIPAELIKEVTEAAARKMLFSPQPAHAPSPETSAS